MPSITKRNLENKLKIIARRLQALLAVARGQDRQEKFQQLPDSVKNEYRRLEKLRSQLSKQLKSLPIEGLHIVVTERISLFKSHLTIKNESETPENTQDASKPNQHKP